MCQLLAFVGNFVYSRVEIKGTPCTIQFDVDLHQGVLHGGDPNPVCVWSGFPLSSSGRYVAFVFSARRYMLIDVLNSHFNLTLQLTIDCASYIACHIEKMHVLLDWSRSP